MSDFFKQLLAQLSDIWTKLNINQKIITVTVIVLTFVGLITLIVWAGYNGNTGKYQTLFSNLALSESADIVEQLKEGSYDYRIENGGRTIVVPKKNVYELRMTFAKLGLPKTGGIGYEIFDKTNLGMTDFVQKLNYKRALEGEIASTIAQLQEIEKARVHIVIPKETIFIQKQKNATASVVLKLRPGASLTEHQVRGVANLVSFSVEGLKRKNISILDTEGRILSDAYGSSEIAERTSNQMQLQNKVEQTLTKKAQEMLNSVLGPNKSKVKISAELDFERVSQTQELFDPESKVVRSEERNEESANGTQTGNEARENSITNYEINKTIKSITGAVGAVKNVSISVAVDGLYETDKDGKRTYIERSAEEILKLEELVKRAVGYSVSRGDEIVVYNLRFNNQFVADEVSAMEIESRNEMIMEILKGAVIVAIILIFILFLRSLAKNVVEALNPPVPQFVGIGEEEEEEVLPVAAARTNEIIEKVEMLTQEDPNAVVSILRGWMTESAEA